MSKIYQLKNKKLSIQLDRKPFASGGEGAIYDIVQPSGFEHHVAKIIHDFKHSDTRIAKLHYLVDNQPDLAKHKSGEQPPLIWVEDLILDDKNKVVGFIMPRVSGEKLEILCSPRMPKSLSADWLKHERGRDGGLQFRLKVCHNLAQAVAELHATGRYVLADLKPDNVIVRLDGSISLVDMDSIEVLQGEQTLFAATVATPDYTPPEYYTQGIEPGKKPIEPTWDRFSLSVIFYRIMLGIHPFAASCKPPHDTLTTLADKIQLGFFVHDEGKQTYFSVIPPPHKAFSDLDEGLRFAFLRTFDAGHDDREMRVSAQHWATIIKDSPLLLSHRPLPSSLINMPDLHNINWLEEAYNNMLERLQKVNNKSNDDTTLPSNFITIGAMVVVVVLLILMLTRLTAFGILGPVFVGILLIVIVSLVINTRKSSPQKSLGNPNIDKLKIPKIQPFDYQNNKNLKTLEDHQHNLFSTRNELKDQLRRSTAELNILEQIYKKRRREILAQHNKTAQSIIDNIKTESQNKIQNLKIDEKARQLMQREQADIENHYAKTQVFLRQHPIFSQLSGTTPNQKAIQIEAWVQQQDLLTTEEKSAKINALNREIEAVQTNLRQDIQATQADYQQLHASLHSTVAQEQQAVEQFLSENLQRIQKATQLDEQLQDSSFSEIIQQRTLIQDHIGLQEQRIEQLNYEVRRVREALQRVS
jgi:serine/threonine protein kinase